MVNAIVVTGAAPLDRSAVASLADQAAIIAADGGLDHALAAGLRPSVLVGDLDSVSAAGLDWAAEHATIDRHDPAKDFTDTQLALAAAVELNPDRLTLVAGEGDRLDHTLAAIGALGDPELTSVPILDGWWGDQYFRVVHGPGEAGFNQVTIGTHLSLLATHGTCAGVDATGVRWPLDDFELAPLSGRGVSNEVIDSTVRVAVRTNVLTVMFPGVGST